MGLLERLRRSPGEARPAPEQEAAAETVPARNSEVIRSEDLYHQPEWMQVPPPAPLLAPMPFVVSREFDKDLVSWQVPELFIAPLGHSVSESAPSGVVEAISVLDASSPVDTETSTSAGAAPDIDLTLATPRETAAAATAAPPKVDKYPSLQPQYRSIFAVPDTSDPGEPDDHPAVLTTRVPAADVEQADRQLAAEPTYLPEGDVETGPTPAALPLADTAVTAPLTSDPSRAPAAPPVPLGADEIISDPSVADRSDFTGDEFPLAGSPPSVPASPGAPLIGDPGRPPAVPVSRLESDEAAAPAGSVAPLVGDPARAPTTPVALPVAGDSVPVPLASEPASDLRGGELPLAGGAPSAPAGPAPTPQIGRGQSGSPTQAETHIASVERLVAPGSIPLVQAPVPADLPIVQLPVQARLEAGAPSADVPGPLAGTGRPEGEAVTGLVGEHPIGEALADAQPELGATADADRAEVVERPLAPLPVPTRADDVPAPAGVTSPLFPPRPFDAESTDPGQPGPTQTPGPPRRAGLGAPIVALPATAASFDVTDLVKTAAGRARILSLSGQGPPSGGSVTGKPAPGRTGQLHGLAGTALAPTGPTWAEMPLVTSGAEPRGPVVALESVPTALARPDFSGLPEDTGHTVPVSPFGPGTLDRPTESVPQADGGQDGASSAEGAFVRTAVGIRHGVDLSAVPVNRSPAAAAEAHGMTARGFTSSAGVVIPPELGSLDSGPGAALLAHELTHVAQRSRFGPEMAPEGTSTGRTLEAEALDAEMSYAPDPMAVVDRRSPSVDRSSPAGDPDESPPPLPVAAAPRSEGIDRGTLTAMLREIVSDGAPGFSTAGSMASAEAMAPTVISAPASMGVQRAEEPQAAAPSATAAASHGDGGGPFATRPDDKQLSRFVSWIYPLIAYRVRSELRDGRERAGMLTDTYGRW